MDAEDTTDNMSDRLRRSKQSFNEIRAETQAKARRAVRITDNYAHDHPWRMVASAAGFAFVVGLLMRKGPRRIIVSKSKDAPVLKMKHVQPKGSAWEAVSIFVPIAIFAAKTAMASRTHKNSQGTDAAALC